MSNKRGNKKHTPLSQDFFALGSNVASTSQAKLPKRPEQFPQPGSSKRLVQFMPISPKPSTSNSQEIVSTAQSWEENAKIIPVQELKDQILQLDCESDSEELIEQLLCGAAKQLRDQKTKPDSLLVFTLMYLNKIRPLYFCSNIIVEAFSSLLRRENLVYFKSKNNQVPVLIINLFQHAFHDENTWPEIFVKLYIEDCLSDRVWVDSDECKEFVEIIVATFHTKLAPKALLQTSDLSVTVKVEEPVEEQVTSTASFYADPPRDPNQPVTSRYFEIEEQVINYVYQVIVDNLNRRQSINDITRNLLKLLISTAGIRNVRLLVAQKMEHWFLNPKLSRPAQDLLLTIFINCDEKDEETLNYLLKMRLKKQPFIGHFILCFKELLNQNNGTFEIVMNILLNIELSATFRNTINLQLLSIMFQKSPKESTNNLSKFYFSMMYTNDDNIRALRNIFREIVRLIRHDIFDIHLFTHFLLNNSNNYLANEMDMELRKKSCNEVLDILTMIILLLVTQNYREAFLRPDRKDYTYAIQLKIANIQNLMIDWIYNICFLDNETNCNDFIVKLLKKALFMNPQEEYYKLDNWPPENDRSAIFHFAMENIPLFELVFRRILLLGFKPEIPLKKEEACNLVWNLVHRSAINCSCEAHHPVLLLSNVDIIDLLFKCSSYICQDTSRIPPNYTIPNLAQISVYWKIWITLTIICVHVPSIFGRYCWQNFPTFRELIEMAITHNFQFPSKMNDPDELQRLNQVERLSILQFEQYLAQENINETNSYLIHSLIELNPTVLTRRIPVEIMNDYKVFCTKNLNFRALICKSRDPDFVLMIMNKHEQPEYRHEKKLSWLVDLVESYDFNYSLLPYQCLCRFLIKQIGEEIICFEHPQMEQTFVKKELRKDKMRKLLRVIAYLQERLKFNDFGILLYFIDQLAVNCMPIQRCTYKSLEAIYFLDIKSALATLEETGTVALFPERQRLNWFNEKLTKSFEDIKELAIRTCYIFIETILFTTEINILCDMLDFIGDNFNFQEIQDERFAYLSAQFILKRINIIWSVHHKYYWRIRLGEIFNHIFYTYLEMLPKVTETTIKIKEDEDSPFRQVDGNRVYMNLNNRLMKKFVSVHEDIWQAMIIYFVYFYPEDIQSPKKYQKIFATKPYPSVYRDVKKKNRLPLIPTMRVKYEYLAIELINWSKLDIEYILKNCDKESLFGIEVNNNIIKENNRKIVLQYLNSNDSEIKTEDITESGLERDDTLIQNQIEENRTKMIERIDSLCQKFDKNNSRRKLLQDKVDQNELLLAEFSPEFIVSPQFLENFLHLILKGPKSNDSSGGLQIFKAIKTIFMYPKLLEDGYFNSILQVFFTSHAIGLSRNLFKNETNQIKKQLKKFVETSNNVGLKNMIGTLVKDDYTPVKLNNLIVDETKKKNALQIYVKDKESKKLELNHWNNIYVDLAITNYYRNEIKFEQYNDQLLKVIWSRNRPLFLSRILHKSNCSTIMQSIKFVLNEDNPHPINSTLVLDFLNICSNLPNQFIGYEKEPNEDILRLNQPHIKKLIGYVVEENNQIDFDLNKRINLLARTCLSTEERAQFTFNYLSNWNDESTADFIHELYARLYLKHPTLKLTSALSRKTDQIIFNLPSCYDKIVFNLITSFFNTKDTSPLNAETIKQFNFFDNALLIFAAKHPYLMLRHLTTIMAMLQGTVDVVNYDVFKNLNLLIIFHRLLNFLNVLTPYIWQKNELKILLKMYVTMFLSYGQIQRNDGRIKETNMELVPLLNEFIRFIKKWFLHDREEAFKWTMEIENEIRELSLIYPSILGQFTGNILLHINYNEQNEIQFHLSNFLGILNNNNEQELLRSTFLELERFLDKNMPTETAVQERILQTIHRYYYEGYYCIRALSIMMKLLHKNPNLVDQTVDAYISCFSDSSPNVRRAALDILPEYIIFAQEHRCKIILYAFVKCLMQNRDETAKDKIQQSLEALASQQGY